MVGQIQILTYLLCVYLVFKGFEIYQISISRPKEQRNPQSFNFGIFAIILSIILAVLFAMWMNNQADAIGNNMDDFSRW